MARSRTTRGVNAAASAFRAWLRCQPVVAHNSWRIMPFSPRPACLYRVAIVSVTAWRWLIVNSTDQGLPDTDSHGRQARPTRAFLDESTTPPRRAFLMSQRGDYTTGDAFLGTGSGGCGVRDDGRAEVT